MAFLEIREITKQLGGLTAVDHVSLQVERGQIVSIIGPNGAGKTTLFNMLTGIYPLDQGEILLDGVPLKGKTPQQIVEAGIARTFQNIRLFSDMRVIENVLIGTHTKTEYGFWDALFRTPRYRRIENERKQQAVDRLEAIGLGHRVHDYAQSLPYGEQRKLEIARAIATGAQLLLLDEPAAGMNPQESEELRQYILSLKEQGFTILLIEHDMNVVMNLSDHIYVLDYGKKIAEGVAQDILTHPKVIAAYLGEREESHADN